MNEIYRNGAACVNAGIEDDGTVAFHVNGWRRYTGCLEPAKWWAPWTWVGMNHLGDLYWRHSIHGAARLAIQYADEMERSQLKREWRKEQADREVSLISEQAAALAVLDKELARP
jgi:hypothetical protein